MSKEYEKYLASAVLNDEKIVTFRVLSRALGVNSSEAKRMLYNFHQNQNAKRAGSVHATYLVTGYRKASEVLSQTNGASGTTTSEDIDMRSSPFPGSSMPQGGSNGSNAQVKTMTLVAEEQLEQLKSSYSEVSSVHMYSLQSGPLKNLDLITSVYEQLHADSQKSDPLENNKTYGIIQNANVKRRTSHRPPPPPAASQETGTSMDKSSAKAMFQKSSSETTAKKTEKKKAEPSGGKSAGSTPPSSQQSASSTGRPPTVKRESSDLFKSFAKAKAPKPKATTNKGTTDSSASGTHSMPVGTLSTKGDSKETDDVDMGEDEEGDGESSMVTSKKDSKSSADRKSKSERDAELRKQLFDSDDEDDETPKEEGGEEEAPSQDTKDEDMPDAAASSQPEAEEGSEKEEDDDEEMEDSATETPAAAAAKKAKDEGSKEQQVSVSNGRRRGRRRVMRKRMIKDAEGYLVTREEPGWESFSEEDVPAPVPAPAPRAKQPSSSAAAKSKKKTTTGGGGGGGGGGEDGQAGGKKGQGNLLSFFGKKA